MYWWVLGGAGYAIAAVAVVVCWVTRSRAARGARGLDSDPAVRYSRALRIHDDVIQSLVTAKLALELGDQARGMAAMEAGLDNARRIMTELIADAPTVLVPGQLRRDGSTNP